MLAPRPVPVFFPDQLGFDHARDLPEAKPQLVVELDNSLHHTPDLGNRHDTRHLALVCHTP